MDRVRTVAGRSLVAIISLWKDADVTLTQFITSYCLCDPPNVRVNLEIFGVPAKVYPTTVELLSNETFREEMLTGFLTSAGSLGESLVSSWLSD
jgi:Tubulin folding cofactor D C terminal